LYYLFFLVICLIYCSAALTIEEWSYCWLEYCWQHMGSCFEVVSEYWNCIIWNERLSFSSLLLLCGIQDHYFLDISYAVVLPGFLLWNLVIVFVICGVPKNLSTLVCIEQKGDMCGWDVLLFMLGHMLHQSHFVFTNPSCMCDVVFPSVSSIVLLRIAVNLFFSFYVLFLYSLWLFFQGMPPGWS